MTLTHVPMSLSHGGDTRQTCLTESSQLRFCGFQSFLAGIAVFVVDVPLTPVQSGLKESNLINPVGLVLVLFVSHLFGRHTVELILDDSDCPTSDSPGSLVGVMALKP